MKVLLTLKKSILEHVNEQVILVIHYLLGKLGSFVKQL